MMRLFVLIPVLALALWAPRAAADVLAVTEGGALWALSASSGKWEGRGWVPNTAATCLDAGLERNRLYLLGERGVTYTSAGGGLVWAPGPTVPGGQAVDLGVGPDGAVYVLTADGEMWMGEGGAAGVSRMAGIPGSGFQGIAVGSGTLFVLTATGDVLVSENQGAAWVRRAELELDHAVGLRLMNDALLVVGADGGVRRSPDQGRSWEFLEAAPVESVTAIAVSGDSLICLDAAGGLSLLSRVRAWQPLPGPTGKRVLLIGSDDPPVAVNRRNFPEFVVEPPSPNPCRRGEAITVHFRLLGPDTVSLQVVTRLGKILALRGGEGFARAGVYSITWDPGDLPSGHHELRLRSAGGESAELRLVIL